MSLIQDLRTLGHVPEPVESDTEAQASLRKHSAALWGSVCDRKDHDERLAYVRTIAANYGVCPLWFCRMVRDELRAVRRRRKEIGSQAIAAE